MVLTMLADDDWVLAVLQTRAGGYLLKGADTAEVVVVQAVVAGYAVYGSAVAVRIAELSLGGGRREAYPELTWRERALVELFASGARNGQIAAALGSIDKTVRNHIPAILWELKVSDRAAAALKARDRDISGQPIASG
jgi:DNA-binding NarL/FixJ family response regulator